MAKISLHIEHGNSIKTKNRPKAAAQCNVQQDYANKNCETGKQITIISNRHYPCNLSKILQFWNHCLYM
jgi:hypothetical protein